MYRWAYNLKLISYSNSDFTGYVDSHKSILEYIFMMVGRVASWRSAKQNLTATSTMKVEFVSLFKATAYGIWLKSFIFGLRTIDSISRPLRIYYDNSASVFMAKNNRSGSRSKHITLVLNW
jgi:hypothetical protein